MFKPIICCLSVFAVILLIGWILGLIMIHLFEKKLKPLHPSSVVVHINDSKLKPNTYSISKIKREKRSRPKRVEGFQSGKCDHTGKCDHISPTSKIKQRVKPPSIVKTSKSTKHTEHFDPFIGKYRIQSRRAERRFTKHHEKLPLAGFNIKDYELQ